MSYKVAVLGVTGAVGTEMLRVLEARRFPVSELVPLASARSAGSEVVFRGERLTVQEARAEAFEGVDFALMSAGAQRSRQFAPAAVEAGAVVVDNSSAFRMDPGVPLVVPEINGDDAFSHKGIIANPNCAAIILTMGIAPLRTLGAFRRIVVSTYQSASGAGAQAMQELLDQTRGYLDGAEPAPQVFQFPIAFNLFSHNAAIEADGYNGEESKVVVETRKILGMPELGLSVTCVRVPVLRAHCEAINLELDREVTEAEVRAAYEGFAGVRLVDDREHNHFPMPREASDIDDVLVGRIRRDPSHPHAINLFVAGDQLLKGAALNAVQCAELIASRM
jgi:aspartate-semialdehyde dehydrogenase